MITVARYNATSFPQSVDQVITVSIITTILLLLLAQVTYNQVRPLRINYMAN